MLRTFYILFIFNIASSSLTAQSNTWNFTITKEYKAHIGTFLFENDSIYGVLARAVDPNSTNEQGVTMSFIDKKTGNSLFTKYYGETDTDFDFTNVNNAAVESDKLIFPLTKGNSGASVHLFSFDLIDKEFQKILIVPSPYTERNFIFMGDFLVTHDHYYILCGIQTQNTNEPLIIKIDKHSLEYQYIRWKDRTEGIVSYKMAYHNDGIIVFSTYPGVDFLTRGSLITFMDLEGKVLWEEKSPGIVNNNYFLHILPLNDKDILVTAANSFYNYKIRNVVSYFSVMKYDTETKKTIWHTWWNEPVKEGIWYKCKVIPAKNENEYFLMANDAVKVYEDRLNYSTGKIVKFTDTGQRLWQKTYYYNNGWAVNNAFNDIMATQDGNYLITGWVGLGGNPWIVKIDEDGNILPIDTSTSVIDSGIAHPIPEISIYPNPASHSLIINQGEIQNMTYQLTDMTGAVVKTLALPDAHHNVIWDISDIPQGTYALLILQNGKLIGSKQQIIVR